MDLEALHFLLSDEGQRLLAGVSQESLEQEHLSIAHRLRDQIGPRRTHAVLETVLLRGLATAKFSRAAEMYFTRTALQQASAETVSVYRASRYAQAGFSSVADLGCSIGGDSLTLAGHADVIGVDWHAVRLSMAQENVRVYGHAHRFHPLQADLLELTPLPVGALFADPGRRDEQGRRLYSPEQYRPPISYLDRWRERVPHLAIKIGPGVDYGELPGDAEVEFISLDGQVREGTLWFGDLHTGVRRRATILPGGDTLTDLEVGEIAICQPGAFLYEPDGAIIRAHLVEQLALRLEANKIDDNIAYLTADRYHRTPFARCYRLEDALPFQLKRLRSYLRQRNVGRLVIKKRGSPLDPDTLRRRLRLQGDQERVIFLTQVMGKPTVLIGRAQQAAHQAP